MEKATTPADLRRRLGDGRQYGTSIEQIKENHRRRYLWAADRLEGQSVVDCGCGVGYGSWILGETCRWVTGLDFNQHLIEFAQKNWGRPNVVFRQNNLQSAQVMPEKDEAFVAFEVLEHLIMPQYLLCSMRKGAVLFGSVPNGDHAPHSIVSNPFHIRHYSHDEIERLLQDCGFAISDWYHQDFGMIKSGREKAKTILFTAEKRHELPRTTEPGSRQFPRSIESNLIDAFQYELLRRCNVIGDLKKNGSTKDTRGPTAF